MIYRDGWKHSSLETEWK